MHFNKFPNWNLYYETNPKMCLIQFDQIKNETDVLVRTGNRSFWHDVSQQPDRRQLWVTGLKFITSKIFLDIRHT